MHICIVAAARPDFIKAAPLVKAIERAAAKGREVSYSLIYTGNKNDESLETSLFYDLSLPAPHVYLNAVSENLNELTGQVMQAFDSYLQTNETDVVVVVDDLASTMAVAIVTKKHGIKLAHVAAGTRSFDINMPKEINRLVIDGLSDYLFTAGQTGNSIATREGASLSKVFMVGNILMDNIRDCFARFVRPQCLQSLNAKDGSFLVLTLNRKVLIRNDAYVAQLLRTISKYASEDMPVIAPVRNMAYEAIVKALSKEGLQNGNIHVVQSVDYLSFGYLVSRSCGILTDSGNVAEEATFSGVPCVTLNHYTEHVETVKVGTNVLVGNDFELLQHYLTCIKNREWKKHGLPECWDGRTADRIVSILLS